MNPHVYAIRTISLLCLAGKAVAVSFAAVEQGESVSTAMNATLTNFLLLTLAYFSLEFGIRLFIWPNMRKLIVTVCFRRRSKSVQTLVDTISPITSLSPLDSPKAQEVIAYTIGTFAGVITNDELAALELNLKAFILRVPTTDCAVNRRIAKLTTTDIYHFGWNIVRRLKRRNPEMAEFLKSQFPWQLSDVETVVVGKKLSTEDGAFTLPKVEPDQPLPPFPLSKELGFG